MFPEQTISNFQGKGKPYWAPIIEKAFAKLYGSYEKLVSGSPHFIMCCLTGQVVTKEEITENVLSHLELLFKKRHLVTAGTRGGGHMYCVYGIAGKRVKLFDPNNLDPRHYAGKVVCDERFADLKPEEMSGCFTITVKEFAQKFGELFVCHYGEYEVVDQKINDKAGLTKSYTVRSDSVLGYPEIVVAVHAQFDTFIHRKKGPGPDVHLAILYSWNDKEIPVVVGSPFSRITNAEDFKTPFSMQMQTSWRDQDGRTWGTHNAAAITVYRHKACSTGIRIVTVS